MQVLNNYEIFVIRNLYLLEEKKLLLNTTEHRWKADTTF